MMPTAIPTIMPTDKPLQHQPCSTNGDQRTCRDHHGWVSIKAKSLYDIVLAYPSSAAAGVSVPALVPVPVPVGVGAVAVGVVTYVGSHMHTISLTRLR